MKLLISPAKKMREDGDFLAPRQAPALLERAAEAYTGQKRRVTFQVGKPPQVDPPSPSKDDNFDDLLALGQQFGNFTVK